MVLGTYAFAFSVDVAAPPSTVREWTIRSVTGGGGPADRPGNLTILEEGPDRFASRYTWGRVRQLRVVEWTGADHVDGAVVHTVGRAARLAARYTVDVSTSGSGTRLRVRYALETPILGLALSFRLSRRRTLARRLAASWLRFDDAQRWATLAIEPRGRAPPSTGAG